MARETLNLNALFYSLSPPSFLGVHFADHVVEERRDSSLFRDRDWGPALPLNAKTGPRKGQEGGNLATRSMPVIPVSFSDSAAKTCFCTEFLNLGDKTGIL